MRCLLVILVSALSSLWRMSFLMAHTFSKRFQHSHTRIADCSKADLSFLRLDLSIPGGYVRFLYVVVIAATQET